MRIPASAGKRASNLRCMMRRARASPASDGAIPGRRLAQVRVMIRLPPCAVSMRRTVVPIGSDGVIPQRGRPPNAAR